MLTDDPIAIVLHAVFLLAAGMYPMGMMLGSSCSPCCECSEPCSKCNHAYNGTPGEGRCNVEFRYSYSVNGDEVSGTKPPGMEDVDDAPDAGNGEEFNCNGYKFGLVLRLSAITPGLSNDACGCETCCSFALTFAGLGGFSNPIFGFDFCDCDQTVFEMDIDWPDLGFAYQALGGVRDFCPEVFQQFLSRAETSTVSVRLEIDPCECGACCTEGECESPTTDFYCDTNNKITLFNLSDDRDSEWQGVGTDCDPNSCES
jgi:hypothetical protein